MYMGFLCVVKLTLQPVVKSTLQPVVKSIYNINLCGDLVIRLYTSMIEKLSTISLLFCYKIVDNSTLSYTH